MLAAIAAVPRERFLPADLWELAYADEALPIGAGQTISQPLVVARMLELLAPAPGERALDVGTGSGYHAALLAQLGARVWSVERHVELADAARARLDSVGIENVEVICADGAAGLASEAPFDLVNVAAAAAELPPALTEQLAEGGRLVAPLGAREQRLVRIRRDGGALTRETLERVRFVPLV